MLLEFKTKNYKSFVDEARFSMVAAPKQSDLDYSLMTTKIKEKEIKGLCSSVIYGPNAAGKTNIFGAMDVFRTIVLQGNIRNSEEKASPNVAAKALELIPNSKYSTPVPVEFSVEFIEGDMLIQYELSIDLGTFLDIDYQRRIVSETLTVNGEMIYDRSGEQLKTGNIKAIRKFLLDITEKNIENSNAIAKHSLNKEELFLTNGFKLIYAPNLTRIIVEWFANKFMVIYQADSMQLIKRFADPQKKAVYIEKTTDKAAKIFGINSNAIGYAVNDDEQEAKLFSIFENVNEKKNTALVAELFESYGTLRFINMFPLVIKAIQTGGTLIVDEFDASIHPMALMSIINVFHNDDVNIHHAQLIFNTHNPIFLNSNLFRRDEIKFVERDDSHHSTLYALSDFGTIGDKGVCKHEGYMSKYLNSHYGAINDIDFTPIFEEIIKEKGER